MTGTSNGGRDDSIMAVGWLPDLNSIGPGRGGGRAIPGPVSARPVNHKIRQGEDR